jgi:hypothetical protein
MSSSQEEKKPEIVITDKSYNYFDVALKFIPKEFLGMDLKYERDYTYIEDGVEKTATVNSFSEFREKVGI